MPAAIIRHQPRHSLSWLSPLDICIPCVHIGFRYLHSLRYPLSFPRSLSSSVGSARFVGSLSQGYRPGMTCPENQYLRAIPESVVSGHTRTGVGIVVESAGSGRIQVSILTLASPARSILTTYLRYPRVLESTLKMRRYQFSSKWPQISANTVARPPSRRKQD